MDLCIGVVGAPSRGKSTLFNAVTDGKGKAKVGNYPFTTIEPNTGITYYRCECPCKSRGKTALCRPRYGRCVDGERHIPVRLLDVAGLIPGASKGAGLGNKFLNDLTGAHVLMHIVDVSGTTDEKGRVTEGYDPINDIDWLDREITEWVFGNLWTKWTSTVRKHVAAKQTAVATFQSQLSGYGANTDMVHKLVKNMGLKEPVNLSAWGEDEVRNLARTFVAIRFPTVFVLNKADVGRHTDRNISRITDKYDEERCFVCSAASECYLKKLRRQGYIRYDVGASCFTTLEDLDEADLAEEAEFKAKFEADEAKALEGGDAAAATTAAAAADAATAGEAEAGSGGGKAKGGKAKGSGGKGKKAKRGDHVRVPLIPLTDKVRSKLDKIADMVVFRWGGTGVWDAIQAACELRQPVVAYPVLSVANYSTEHDGPGVFGTALLVSRGTTMKELAFMVSPDIGRGFEYAEAEGGRRMGEDEVVTSANAVVRFVFSRARSAAAAARGRGTGAGAGAGAGASAHESKT